MFSHSRVCMYMHVCILYVHMYVYAARVRICVHVCMHVCMCVCAGTCIVCICMHAYIDVYTLYVLSFLFFGSVLIK